jgi:alpha-1,3-glucan synthase
MLGGAPITSWVYRACIIQGTQQIFVSFLWYWGSWMAAVNNLGSGQYSLANSNPHGLSGVGVSVACLLWTIGILILFGLPDYYRQVPGKVPTFYRTLFRRRIILVCLWALSFAL